MTFEMLQEAKTECLRFMGRVAALEAAYEALTRKVEALNIANQDRTFYHGLSDHPAETGAVRRASLDLTRALAKMRRHGG